MSNTIGEKIKCTIFGQSHSKEIGVVIDGLPAGNKLDMDYINSFMLRRSPGKNDISTARNESDIPEIVSGVVEGITCGAPLCAVIKNTDCKSQDYEKIKSSPRPGHADYTAYIKSNGYNDIRGGGEYSGRLTAPLTFAGAVCCQILKEHGVKIGAHIYSIGDIEDEKIDMLKPTYKLFSVCDNDFPTIEQAAALKMKRLIEDTKNDGDSIGGIIECAVVGFPCGYGEPMFGGVENKIASNIFGIPAVKGIEFGLGFDVSRKLGSENNDPYEIKDGVIVKKSNNSGGILGGITDAAPIVFRVAVKPTPSIAKEQDTIDLSEGKNTKLTIEGRHDPCIVPRAVPVVEAVTAITLINLL